MSKKSIWESTITVHFSIREDMNSVLLALARDKDIKVKSTILQKVLETHPDYIKKKEEMEKENYFF